MRLLRNSDYRIMPWKNGGGSTTELAIFPEQSGLSGDPFLWRVSIADVVSDAPFSNFPGYDRHIMVIEGGGMTIDAGEHGELDLSKPFRPVRFPGDWSVYGRLTRGPVRDFNFMVAQSFAQSALTVEELAAKRVFWPDGNVSIVHILDGEAMANGHIAAAGDTVIIEANEAVELKLLAKRSRLAVCRISPP